MSEVQKKRDIETLCHVQQGLSTDFIHPKAGY